MAKGQQIDELYISLGLDINDLKLGFDTAGKTVNQAITKLNNEHKKIQLKTDVDISKLKDAGSELDRIKLKHEAINRQLDIQRQKEEILQAQYQRALKDYGADHYVTSRAEMSLLKQQGSVAKMEAELRELSKKMGQEMAAESTKALQHAVSSFNGSQGAKLKADIDLKNLDSMSRELDKIKLKHESINQLLDAERQKEAALKSEYQQAASTYGVNSNEAATAHNNLLQQQSLLVGMNSELHRLSKHLTVDLPAQAKMATQKINKESEVIKLKANFDLADPKNLEMALAKTKEKIEKYDRAIEHSKKIEEKRTGEYQKYLADKPDNLFTALLGDPLEERLKDRLDRAKARTELLEKNRDVFKDVNKAVLNQANDNITLLNSKLQKVQVKTDIDISKLKGAGAELDRIKVKIQGINQQLEIQARKEEQYALKLRNAYALYGKKGAPTLSAQLDLLNNQKISEQMKNELTALNRQMVALTPKHDPFTLMSNRARGALGAIDALNAGFARLLGPMAMAATIAGTGAGLFNITKDAMMAGNNLYKLQQRLNLTAAEAGQLNRAFKMAGTDISSLTPFITRIDKQLMSAGESGNATSKALKKFGITLTDERGNLLQVNEQLEQLAKGYRNAAEAGEVEAFTAEILGARGAALIPVLEEYNDLIAISKSVKTTGLLNPAEAHETYLEWQKMEMEISQLKLALGSALLPVSKELMPEITEMFVEWIKLISDNKEEIKLMGEILIDTMHESGKALELVASGLDAIGVNAKNVGEILRDIKAEFDAGYGMAVMAAIGSPANLPLIGALSLKDDVKEQRSKNDDAEKTSKAEKEYWADIDKRTKARQKEVAQIKGAKQAEKSRLEGIVKASQEMQESIYGLTHTELETQLHSIDVAMQKYKDAGVSEVEVAKATQAQKAKVIKQFNDDVARSIDSVWKSAFQNRMDEIDREKEAWKQKGLDEVKATKWAEEQKRQLQQETALHMFKENYKYLKLYRKAMAGGGSMEEKQANAMQAIVAQLRKDANLPADAWTSREEMAGFEQLFKVAKENIVPVYDKMPTKFILKGTNAVPMYEPGYEDAVKSKLGNTLAPAPAMATREDINYNLNVEVHGLEDVSHEVANSAAKKILDMMPQNSNVNISYGGR